jgi:hypothetical protein
MVYKGEAIVGIDLPFLRIFIMNESALCYRRMDVWMDVCMDVTKCIVTKLQMLRTSPLAQIYLVTIEIDLPSKLTENSAILAASRHLHFEGQHLKML